MTLRRVIVSAALAAVLALAFMGYLRPELMLNWDALMALCGFG